MRKLETLKRGDLIRFTFEDGRTLNEIVLNLSRLSDREAIYISFVISFGKVLTYGISLKSDVLIKKYKILSK